MSTMLAVAFAPSVGFWMYRHGWGWLCAEAAVLNLGMAAIAFTLEETSVAARRPREKFFTRDLVEWRMVAVSFSLFLCSFGYGGGGRFCAPPAGRSGGSPHAGFFSPLPAAAAGGGAFSSRPPPPRR